MTDERVVTEPADALDGTTLQRIYEHRFEDRSDYRNQVWKILPRSSSTAGSRRTQPCSTSAAAMASSSTTSWARRRYAMDLNPDAAALVDAGVQLLQQDCSSAWPLDDASLDVVFSSNFLEHLPSKAHVLRTLQEAHRCTRPGGHVVLIGPNLRFTGGAYWDYFDHHVPLTDVCDRGGPPVGRLRHRTQRAAVPALHDVVRSGAPDVGATRLSPSAAALAGPRQAVPRRRPPPRQLTHRRLATRPAGVASNGAARRGSSWRSSGRRGPGSRAPRRRGSRLSRYHGRCRATYGGPVRSERDRPRGVGRAVGTWRTSCRWRPDRHLA